MNKVNGFVMGAAMLVASLTALSDQVAASPGGDEQRALARKLVGTEFAPLYDSLCQTAPNVAGLAQEIPATRVFDNLIFLGRGKWTSWALLTSKGIIMFDSLETNAEAEKYIIGGLRSLGLDPKTIRYVVVMHGHGDHFGGAKRLHDRFGARVLMSAADWNLVADTVEATRMGGIGGKAMVNGRLIGALHADQPAPERDMVITDGMTLTLGDTSVRLYLTPGHTEGTVSGILPLRDGKARHVGAYWGGLGYDAKRNNLTQYIASIDKFTKITQVAGADVALSNHPTIDTTLMFLPRLAERKPGKPNPFVIGSPAYGRILGALRACVNATRIDAAEQPMPGTG